MLNWYFALALFEAIGAIVWLLLIPAERGHSSLMGLSLGRVALISPLMLVILVLSWGGLNLWLRPSHSDIWVRRLVTYVQKDSHYWAIIALALAGGIAGINLLGTRGTPTFTQAYLERLAPYAAFFVLFCAQTLIAMKTLRHGWSLEVFRSYRASFKATLLAFGVLMLIAALMSWTGIGLDPDIKNWGAPGVPLLPSQVWLALAITLIGPGIIKITPLFWRKLPAGYAYHWPSYSLDALVFFLLWLGAVWRWNAEPLKASFYTPNPTPPNQEYYPFSDAAKYDLSAQKLLIGAGFEPDVIRPVYSAYIALAQGVSGIGLSSIIAWQIPLLAFIPPLLFLMARALHHRITGLFLGLLIILRESNAIALAGIIDVSNAKMALSDLATTLGVILFSLIVILWLQKPGERRVYPVVVGSVLAVSVLIRLQVILILPAVLLCTWFVLRKQPADWLKSSLVIFVSLLLILSPWLWRNWQLTGKRLIADPQPTEALFRFSSVRPVDDARLPGETDEMFLSRMRASAIRDMLSHPLEIARIINAHFWHNQVATLLALPASFPILSDQQIPPGGLSGWSSTWSFLQGLCCSPITYVRDLDYWKSGWEGTLVKYSWLPVFTNLLLVSTGIGISWNRWRFVGLFPLFMVAAYSLSDALGRISGWRYNLPVDWVGLLFYAIGVVQVCFWMATFFANRFIPHSGEATTITGPGADHAVRPFPWRQAFSIMLVLVMLVASIPLAERLVPARYGPGAVQSALSSLSTSIDQGSLIRFLNSENAVALVGRGMYPRYYPARDGIRNNEWPVYDIQDYSRLGFVMVNPETNPVILPLEGSPAHFPNAADVLVLGCKREDYIEAHLVALLNESRTVIQASPPRPWSCTSP